MRGILNLLAKVNLVELSDEEKAAAGIQSPEMTQAEEAPVPEEPLPEQPPLQDLKPSGNGILENRSVEEIYAAAGLPQSPFPAEKLLRLLEGLAAMDSATRKAAVLAMDAADDNWQISDCIDDANNKIATLGSYKKYMSSQLQAAEEQSVAKIGEIKSGLENATSEIRKQISELEQLLAREIAKSAQQTTGIEAGVQSLRETFGRELRRIDAEIERLREIPSQFNTEKTER